jgi:membrane protease YdiL (CAAX protease family)
MAAIGLSSAVFALQHMQFQLVTILLLFSMGALLAEIFRRTGTLWPGILLHSLSNGLAVALLMLGQQ